jgi:hypothetical protein
MPCEGRHLYSNYPMPEAEPPQLNQPAFLIAAADRCEFAVDRPDQTRAFGQGQVDQGDRRMI